MLWLITHAISFSNGFRYQQRRKDFHIHRDISLIKKLVTRAIEHLASHESRSSNSSSLLGLPSSRNKETSTWITD
jgi:hypothetical protein